MDKSRFVWVFKVLFGYLLFGILLQDPVHSHAPAESKDKWGLGAQIGEPSGLQSRVWLSSRNALDFTLAYSFTESLFVSGSYVWNFTQAVPTDLQKMHFHPYLGAGLFVNVDDEPGTDGSLVGVRFPFGLEFVIPKSPVSIFLDLAVTVGVVPSTDVHVQGALGGRYYF